MSRADDQRVADILDAGAEVATVVELGPAHFLASPIYQRGVERLLEIIGEASNRLSEEFKERHPNVAWRDIGALRIRLAHHYHRVDPEQVWVIAAEHVPELVRALSRRS